MTQESSTSVIFESALRSIILPGSTLELFAPDYTDDVPEAKAFRIEYQATTMYYCAPSRVSGVWVMYMDASAETVLPGYSQHPRNTHTEILSLHSKKPKFEKSQLMPFNHPENQATLDSGLQYAQVKIQFDNDHQPTNWEIMSHVTFRNENKHVAAIIADMLHLISHELTMVLK